MLGKLEGTVLGRDDGCDVGSFVGTPDGIELG
jgi:hypothetical protein